MRICSPQLGISPNSILGGEIYDRQILKYLAKKGHEIEIILPFFKPYEKIDNWVITRLPISFVIPPHLFNIFVLPQLFYIYKQRPFDILRIHSPTFLGIAAIIFKKKYPTVPIIGTYHWLGEGGWAEKCMNPVVMNYFDAIVCDSHYMKDKITKKFPKTKNKTYAIHNGVDETLQPKSKPKHMLNKYNIGKSTIVFLFMGLFIDRKNPMFLLPIIKQLVKKNSDILLLLCGKGPLKSQIINSISKLELESHVKLISPVFHQDKNDLLNFADIFVHPAIKEGFSLSVIEAMAVGLPIVMTSGYSAKEAVENNKNGFLCKSKQDWLAKLTLLMQNSRLRNNMGKTNIRKVHQQYSWGKAGRKYLALLKHLVSRKKKQWNQESQKSLD